MPSIILCCENRGSILPSLLEGLSLIQRVYYLIFCSCGRSERERNGCVLSKSKLQNAAKQENRIGEQF